MNRSLKRTGRSVGRSLSPLAASLGRVQQGLPLCSFGIAGVKDPSRMRYAELGDASAAAYPASLF